MDVRGFTTNGYRLDLTLKYLNGTEEVYSTKNTYELVNFNINTTDKTTLFSNISSTTQLSENTKLYYIKDDSSNNSDDNEKRAVKSQLLNRLNVLIRKIIVVIM